MSKTKTVYIAGPMTGIPEYNKPEFDKAAKQWSELGYAVINPATNFSGNQTLTHAEYMRYSIHQLLIADVIYLLNNWGFSEGAKTEYSVARAIGLEMSYEG